jgi:vesicle-associated membrane protein 72
LISPSSSNFSLLSAAFNYLSSQGYTFLVVADEAYGRQVPFAFLERVRDEWFAKWADKGASASAHSLDKTFGGRLKYWMEYCESHPDEVSKVVAVQKKVDEVKGIMVENIERVLERGEKIELLVDKTDNLRFQADKFHKTGRALRTRMWWQNFKMQIIVVIIVILIAVIIFASVCFSGGNCLN